MREHALEPSVGRSFEVFGLVVLSDISKVSCLAL